ncbi:uncharacterized protein BP5553_07554 [Venustampulla echinocandica]|uniref:Transcription factor domain-containing protein n=1 Tax=Venustampulla echinocandica TaxID=2656787 RepID=A0A370TGV6_9HELO|nr:uncharacterized protein BP5553_07554 [Venustampulla echinocandica]RDL34426.1 hypothetical protein BP5553_07554 [Venustampulla echinocandica]
MDGEAQPGLLKELQFITFTDFKQTTNAETKKIVRSHARRRAHHDTRGECISKRGVIVLDPAPLIGERSPAQQDGDPEKPPAKLPSPSRLGAGRLDPFAAHPIPMSMKIRELVDHLRGDFCPMFRSMTRIGFFASMKDPAGFCQILSTSASHMEQLRGTGAKSPEAIALSTRALRSLNSRLTDPLASISDGVIATILAFCCHGVMFNDLQGSVLHLNGLEQILRLRGGLSTLNPILRMVLFWTDTSIAFCQFVPPRFPAPHNLLPRINKQLSLNASMPLMEASVAVDIVMAMNNLYCLNELIAEKAMAGDIWRGGVFAGLHIVPVLHEFLSIPLNCPTRDPVLIRQDAYQVGAILYLGIIRRRFGMKTYISPDGHSHVRTLKDTITSLEASGQIFDDRTLLWLLLLGSVESIVTQDHQWFVSNLVQSIVRVGCQSWGAVLNYVREVLWIEGLAHMESESLRGEVSTELLSSYGYILT